MKQMGSTYNCFNPHQTQPADAYCFEYNLSGLMCQKKSSSLNSRGRLKTTLTKNQLAPALNEVTF